MKQRSPQWYAWRKGKLGASVAGTVMGLNPWQSPLQLYNEMKGITPPKPMNAAMARGVYQEGEALEWLMATTGKTFAPSCGVYAENDRIIASLDGLSSCGTIIAEIKCSQKIFDKAKAGIIDDYYIAQIQQQMMVYNLKKNLFVAFDGFDGVIIEVPRDDDFIAKMLEAELEFLKLLDTGTPPPYGEDDHVRIVLEDEDAVNEYISLRQQISYLSGLEKVQKGIIEELGDSGNVELCSKSGKALLRLTRVQKAGSVNWKALCEKHGIADKEIDTYRKEQIGFYRYSVVK